MGLPKQAKTLSSRQLAHLLSFLSLTRHPDRSRAIVLLSAKAGLRAKEIACLTWEMITESDGELSAVIRLRNEATKGASGRVIPMNRDLAEALRRLHPTRGGSSYVIASERSQQMSAAGIVNLFGSWYRRLGLYGCSSHSGRRTFITNAARKIATVGGSLRDVRMLAGHAALSTTQRYIEADVEAQRRVVDLV